MTKFGFLDAPAACGAPVMAAALANFRNSLRCMVVLRKCEYTSGAVDYEQARGGWDS